jgi:hypothetical protein
MKAPHTPSLAIVICNVLLITSIAVGQSVTINSISGTSFCAGDSISVTFTATGFWGHRNAFTLQLSDPTGSFSNFKNIGSLVDTLPGTFTINWIIPGNTTPSMNYRVRILAAIPYTTSADNGNDITIGTGPDVNFAITDVNGYTGTPITFTAGLGGYPLTGDLNDTAFWDFGPGAVPAKATTTSIVTVKTNLDVHGNWELDTGVSFSQDVSYSTPGVKTVTLTVVKPAGCSTTMAPSKLHIYDCSIPSIPHDAIVINPDTTVIVGSFQTYWVNPGATLFNPGGDTIFAEPGSTITGASGCVIYMKPGSVLTNSGSNSVIFGDGVSISDPKKIDFTLSCPNLNFDYTDAPPNAAHPVDAVVNASLPSLSISPNPTTGIISIQGAPSNDLNISVMNLLGETVMEQKNLHSPNFTLDLSKLVPGVYYIRFSSANSVMTKKVVRQ